MAKEPKAYSSFLVDKKELSQEDLWKLIFYFAGAENNEEKWELEISDKFHWLTAHTRGEDTGKFYHWLVAKGLDKKIEILRYSA